MINSNNTPNADHGAVFYGEVDPVVVEASPYNGGNAQNYPIATAKLLGEVEDIPTRHAFIRKVYIILFIQLAVTFGFTAMCLFVESVQTFLQENTGLYYAAIGIAFVMVIAISCCPETARKFPHGPILLSVFTLAESVAVGFITTFYEVDEVLLAMAITVIVVFSLSLFACQTKFDFTGLGPYLFVGLIILLCFGFVLIFIDQSREVTTVYAALGTLLFSVYLVYDTQLVVGGGHTKYQYSVDDYIFAALSLYLDIINLFMYILLLVGGGGD